MNFPRSVTRASCVCRRVTVRREEPLSDCNFYFPSTNFRVFRETLQGVTDSLSSITRDKILIVQRHLTESSQFFFIAQLPVWPRSDHPVNARQSSCSHLASSCHLDRIWSFGSLSLHDLNARQDLDNLRGLYSPNFHVDISWPALLNASDHSSPSPVWTCLRCPRFAAFQWDPSQN